MVASRTTELTAADLAAGCVPFLHAEPGTLAAEIRAQDARRSLAADASG